MEEQTYKLTKKEITIKGYGGNPLILPANTKVYKDHQGKFTSTIFQDGIPFREEDLIDPS